jgi:hypothetical protein
VFLLCGALHINEEKHFSPNLRYHLALVNAVKSRLQEGFFYKKGGKISVL